MQVIPEFLDGGSEEDGGLSAHQSTKARSTFVFGYETLTRAGAGNTTVISVNTSLSAKSNQCLSRVGRLPAVKSTAGILILLRCKESFHCVIHRNVRRVCMREERTAASLKMDWRRLTEDKWTSGRPAAARPSLRHRPALSNCQPPSQ